MDAAERKLQHARDLMVSGRPQEAEKIINGLIDECPEELVCSSARFIRARAYEDGTFGKVQSEAAMSDFLILRNSASVLSVEGSLGCARLMLRKDAAANGEAAASLCEEAAAVHRDTRAMMLLGYIYEDILKNEKLARRWYLLAYRHGSSWGLRYFAALQMRQKKYIRGILAHIVATLTAPVMALRFGVRGPFK